MVAVELSPMFSFQLTHPLTVNLSEHFFAITDEEIKIFRTWAERQGTEESPIEISEEDWEVSGNSIALRLKAFLGRNVYEQSTFYRIIGDLNESIQEAVKILKDGTFEKSNLAHKTFK